MPKISLFQIFASLGIPGLALGIFYMLFKGFRWKFPAVPKQWVGPTIVIFIIVTGGIILTTLILWAPNPNNGTRANDTMEKIDTVLAVVKDSTFTFIDYDDDTLASEIEEITGYKYNKNSLLNKIQITYSGKINTRSSNLSNLCYYPGGNVRIIVSQKECHSFENLKLSETLKAGNPCNEVNNKVIREVKDRVSKNRKLVASKIKECLQ